MLVRILRLNHLFFVLEGVGLLSPGRVERRAREGRVPLAQGKGLTQVLIMLLVDAEEINDVHRFYRLDL